MQIMRFFKPNKLNLAIVLCLFSPLAGLLLDALFNLSANAPSPNIIRNILQLIATLYYYIFVCIVFGLLKATGLNVGRVITGWFSFPSPNALGWTLIAIINIFIYYLLGSCVSFLIKSETKRKALFYFFLLLTVTYVLSFASVVPTQADRKSASCAHQCLSPAQASYNACLSACGENFTEICTNSCNTSMVDFIRQCNAECLSKPAGVPRL